MNNIDLKRCTKGLWDTTISDISFNSSGVSNYCRLQESLMKMYPKNEEKEKRWSLIVEKIKRSGFNKKYDCIIGVSRGTNSSYLLHIAKGHGLKPLAVNLDNGWSSDISVKNIKKITEKLNIDLETYVIDYEEVKIVLKSYVLASLPWVDSPTDLAIKATLFKIAAREGIKYILTGADFRSEGKQPLHWTYSDSRQMSFLVKKYYNKKLRSFPYLTLSGWLYFGYFRRIKTVRPLYFIPYDKIMAMKLLEKEYGWEYYGGHHHENIFTKFVIGYWLPAKFNIDKRIITLSAQILSGTITRKDGLNQLVIPPFNADLIEKEIQYVSKKLDFTRQEFDAAFNSPCKYFFDYPSYYPIIKKFRKVGKFIANKIFNFEPGFFVAIDQES
jgi:N-acetyl sugar amidotransferase